MTPVVTGLLLLIAFAGLAGLIAMLKASAHDARDDYEDSLRQSQNRIDL